MNMSQKSDSSTSTLRAIATTFRLTGWISFWTQLVLGVVAIVILTFTGISRQVTDKSVNTGLGIFFALAGVLTLIPSVYWAFRYTRIAKQLQSSNPSNRPRKADTIQLLRLGLIVNLVGATVSLVGAEAIVGALLTKSLTVPQVGAGVYQLDPSRIIQSIDIFVVQANTNTITAHFVGLAASIWLLNRLTNKNKGVGE